MELIEVVGKVAVRIIPILKVSKFGIERVIREQTVVRPPTGCRQNGYCVAMRIQRLCFEQAP